MGNFSIMTGKYSLGSIYRKIKYNLMFSLKIYIYIYILQNIDSYIHNNSYNNNWFGQY